MFFLACWQLFWSFLLIFLITYIIGIVQYKIYALYLQQVKTHKMDRLWRSKTTVQPKQQPKQELLLPNTIGCLIIELEMEIDDGNISKNVIIELLQEYTKAVEFYEEKGDQRHKLYQKKIQNFLQKPTVDALLKGTQDKNNFLLKKQKAQQQIRKAININAHTVKKMVESSDQGAQKQKIKIQKQLNFQLQNLQKRLQKKRVNNQKVKGISSSFSVSSAPDQGFLNSFKQIKSPKNRVLM